MLTYFTSLSNVNKNISPKIDDKKLILQEHFRNERWQGNYTFTAAVMSFSPINPVVFSTCPFQGLVGTSRVAALKRP